MNRTTILNNNIFHIIIIIVLSFTLYSNTFHHQFNLDDTYILNAVTKSDNSILNVFKTPYHLNDYRPITVLSFYIEKSVFNTIEPNKSHVINNLLYVLLCISIYSYIKALPIKTPNQFAFLVTLLFTVLPIHAEVVNSLKNRDNLLSMLFMMMSLKYLMIAYQTNILKNYFLGIFLFALAFFSKTDSIVLPVIFILNILFFSKVNFKKTATLMVFVLLILIGRNSITKTVTKGVEIDQGVSFTENPIMENMNLPNKLSLSIQTYMRYLKMMIDPNDNFLYYGFNVIPLKSLFDIGIIISFLFLIGILLYSLKVYKTNNLILYGYLFFLASLIYCANFFVPVSGIVANRYAFIASLGFCIFAIGLLELLIQFFSNKTESNFIKSNTSVLALGIIVFVFFIFSTYTYSRNKDWKNIYTLIKADLPRLQNSFEANRIGISNVLFSGLKIEGNKELRENLIKEALQYGLNAQKLYNKDSYINEKVGLAYQELGNWKAAKKSYLLNSTIEHNSPYSWEYLGDIYFTKEGKYDSAAICFSNAIKINSDYDTPFFKYLNASYRSGRKIKTYEYFRKMEREQPDNWIPVQCIGYYYLFEKDSLLGFQYIKKSFDLGYRDPMTADYVREKLLYFGDKKSAFEIVKFTQ